MVVDATKTEAKKDTEKILTTEEAILLLSNDDVKELKELDGQIFKSPEEQLKRVQQAGYLVLSLRKSLPPGAKWLPTLSQHCNVPYWRLNLYARVADHWTEVTKELDDRRKNAQESALDEKGGKRVANTFCLRLLDEIVSEIIREKKLASGKAPRKKTPNPAPQTQPSSKPAPQTEPLANVKDRPITVTPSSAARTTTAPPTTATVTTATPSRAIKLIALPTTLRLESRMSQEKIDQGLKAGTYVVQIVDKADNPVAWGVALEETVKETTK